LDFLIFPEPLKFAKTDQKVTRINKKELENDIKLQNFLQKSEKVKI